MNYKKSDLNFLEQKYIEEGNQVVVLYGRRDIGKTSLTLKFCEDKKYVYYQARSASALEQKNLLGREIEEQYQIHLAEYSYDNFFTRVRSGDASRLVLVIDEFQHIVKKDPDFLKSIVKLKKKKLYPGPVLVVLLTSSVVWAENELPQLLTACGKNFASVYECREWNFVDLVQSFEAYSVSECIKLYGVFGGIAGYLQHIDPKKSVEENIKSLVLDQKGALYHEAEHYLSTELREVSVYHTILGAIAAGHEKLNDLYHITGFSRAKISVYMKNLKAFGVIEKNESFETGGWENAKKGLYKIENTFLNFWFRFVYLHMSRLQTMDVDTFYDSYIKAEMDQYLNPYFIKVCAEYLKLMSMIHRLPIQIKSMGTWVGKQGVIDIIAQDEVREKIIGQCNWTNDEMKYEEYEKLLKTMEKAKIKSKYYYLFSSKSFESKLVDAANRNNGIVLVDMTKL